MATYEKIQEAIQYFVQSNSKNNYYVAKSLEDIKNAFEELANPKYEYGIMDSNREVCSLKTINNDRWSSGDSIFLSLEEWINETPLAEGETTVRRLRGQNGLWEEFSI